MDFYKTQDGIYLDRIPTTNLLFIESKLVGKLIKDTYLYDERFYVIKRIGNLTQVVIEQEQVLLEDNKYFLTIYTQKRNSLNAEEPDIRKMVNKSKWDSRSYKYEATKLYTYEEVINTIEGESIEYNFARRFAYFIENRTNITSNLCNEILLG